MNMKTFLSSLSLAAMILAASCAISGRADAQEAKRDHFRDRNEIAEAFSLGRPELAMGKLDALFAGSESARNPVLRRLDLLQDVAVILLAGEKSGLAEVAAELRKIPLGQADKLVTADAWAQVGEIEERLLDDFQAAKASYRNALMNSADNARAKRGLERMVSREQLSLRFQREQEAMRAGRIN